MAEFGGGSLYPKKALKPQKGAERGNSNLAPEDKLAESGAGSLRLAPFGKGGEALINPEGAEGGRIILTPVDKLAESGAGSLHLVPFVSGGG